MVDIIDCVEAFKLVTYCIYKDEFALDRELREAIRAVYEEYPEIQEKRSKSKNKKHLNSLPRTGSIKTEAINQDKS